MKLLHNPGRHAVLTYSSDDEGETWQKSHVLDLGGRGHHDGTMEAALAELKDGRLWMLVRTNWGVLWNAFSNDGGSSWRTIGPSNVDASSSPGFLRRLASGRIALVWNRCRPEHATDYPLQGGDGQLSDVPASWHREELSIAFTNDEGKTWTDPVVIARKPKGNVSYPYVFEVEPGRLWVFAGEGLQAARTNRTSSRNRVRSVQHSPVARSICDGRPGGTLASCPLSPGKMRVHDARDAISRVPWWD